MSEEENEQLDQMLSENFRRRLDPQIGRASAAFEAATEMSSTRPHRLLPLFVGVGGLIAAAVLIAWPLLQDRPDGHGGVPKVAAIPTTTIRAAASDDVNVERLVLWRAVDEGASVVNSTVPVRKLRYEAVEQIEWEDPVDQATIQLSVPVAEVVLVQQPTF
jgi:hypothetical protein